MFIGQEWTTCEIDASLAGACPQELERGQIPLEFVGAHDSDFLWVL